MMAAFLLSTLYFAQRARGGPDKARPPLPKDSTAWLGSSVACCGLGMACKETMVVAPIIVLLYDRFRTVSFHSLTRDQLTKDKANEILGEVAMKLGAKR